MTKKNTKTLSAKEEEKIRIKAEAEVREEMEKERIKEEVKEKMRIEAEEAKRAEEAEKIAKEAERIAKEVAKDLEEAEKDAEQRESDELAAKAIAPVNKATELTDEDHKKMSITNIKTLYTRKEFAALMVAYKKQNPEKYMQKRSVLEAKLASLPK